jgi:hypothetical protein
MNNKQARHRRSGTSRPPTRHAPHPVARLDGVQFFCPTTTFFGKELPTCVIARRSPPLTLGYCKSTRTRLRILRALNRCPKTNHYHLYNAEPYLTSSQKRQLRDWLKANPPTSAL